MAVETPLILVADDEEHMRSLLVEVLKRWGYRVITAASGAEALEQCRENQVNLAILDVKMPGMSGIEVTKRLKERYPEIAVIILTAYATVRNAVEAMKLGAFDYLTKPFQMDELRLAVEKALTMHRLTAENKVLRSKLALREKFDDFVGYSNVMQQVFQRVAKVAPTDCTVLILGESGTGKSLLARLIHEASSRHQERFVTVNCAALPESLVESELFGYEKGAFTGAATRKPGKFELAHKGTLFLDEISTMSLSAQAKLLNVLQEPKFERIGGTETITVDTRVIAATNRDLKEMVQQGKFREDLYFRLNVVPIELPPLRKRREDIPYLVEYFLRKFNEKFGVEPKTISKEALKLLMSYDWPGNVRELENTVKRMVILSEGKEINTEDLPEHLSREAQRSGVTWEEGDCLDSIMSRIEREVIIEVLSRCNWKRTEAARKLKISRRSLYNKMARLNIIPEKEKKLTRNHGG
ncbi:sigma-54-dependent transcriptional regulator [Calderihabitans maritimus]|uniref:Stage 0 sporulation protein A homolog n=1 Tax=Calderihabitans maritimus TaxID=1246530 RepID=A0A1Z5HWM8_9FIRM|nr:sigma-54 dependent transcriptional regulator [Calderihabitans maritimus]GAW93942.1 NtrC family two-component system response regulator [Calderihabitans maritimus]